MASKKKSVAKKPAKKKVKKRETKKFVVKKEVELPKSEVKIEKILIENFVALQKVMVNLSVKFDNLTNQISKLLDLFELSAKALAEKDFSLEKTTSDTGAISKKMDAVLDQNKIIARGLTLMHEKVNEPPNYPPMQIPEKQKSFNAPRHSFRPMPNPTIKQESDEEYHKSISSKEKEFP